MKYSDMQFNDMKYGYFRFKLINIINSGCSKYDCLNEIDVDDSYDFIIIQCPFSDKLRINLSNHTKIKSGKIPGKIRTNLYINNKYIKKKNTVFSKIKYNKFINQNIDDSYLNIKIVQNEIMGVYLINTEIIIPDNITISFYNLFNDDKNTSKKALFLLKHNLYSNPMVKMFYVYSNILPKKFDNGIINKINELEYKNIDAFMHKISFYDLKYSEEKLIDNDNQNNNKNFIQYDINKLDRIFGFN